MLGAGAEAYVGVHCWRHGGWTTESPLCAMTSASIPVNRLRDTTFGRHWGGCWRLLLTYVVIVQREKRGLHMGKKRGSEWEAPELKEIFASDPEITFAAAAAFFFFPSLPVSELLSSIRNVLSTRLVITENTKWKLFSDIAMNSLPHSVSLMIFLRNCHKICTFNLWSITEVLS